MSDLHYQTVAEHLLAEGFEIVIAGETVHGKKKSLGYEESRELQLRPGSESYRITVPKADMSWQPAPGLKVSVDGKIFTVGDTRDLVTCYRFVITRYGR